MRDPGGSNSISEHIWRIFVSVRFTVVLLVLWMLGSVIGTLIPQNAPPWQVVRQYGASMSDTLSMLGFFDVYHSGWYSLILLLLSLNIVACSLNFFKSKRALAVEAPRRKLVKGRGKKFINMEFPAADEREVTDRLENALGHRFKKVLRFEKDGALHLFAHKQPWAHFMVYLVHLSLIVIVLGGMISALFGFEGVMEIPEGQQRDYVLKKTANRYSRQPLPFEIRCDSFELQRFKSGMTKDYVSKLTVIENGEEKLSRKIEVNTPLSFGGYNFYQSTYSEAASLNITDIESGKSAHVALAPGGQESIPELGIVAALESFRPGKAGASMTASLIVARANGESYRSMVTADKETNAAMQKRHSHRINFAGSEPVYTTGLMVVNDPGAIWIWIGSFLMVAGLYLTFYTSHRRLSIVIEGGKARLCGHAHRNPSAYRREIEKLLERADVETGETDEGANA